MAPDWHLVMRLLAHPCLHLEVKQHASIQLYFSLAVEPVNLCMYRIGTACCALKKDPANAAQLGVPTI